MASIAAKMLARQLNHMQNKGIPGISCGLADDDDIFEWDIMIMIDDESHLYSDTSSTLPPCH